MKACGNGHLPVVVELLDNGAGMWCAGPMDDPKTPFMWAAHHGQLGVIRYGHVRVTIVRDYLVDKRVLYCLN